MGLLGCFKGETYQKAIVLLHLLHYDHVSTHSNNFKYLEINCIHMGLIWSWNSCGGESCTTLYHLIKLDL